MGKKGKKGGKTKPANKNEWRAANKSKWSKKKHDYTSLCETKFSEVLATAHLKVKVMEMDGNCLFRSIVDQLAGNGNGPEQHLLVREDVMNYMDKHSDFFSLFVEDDEGFADYIDRMRQPGQWGGPMELSALALVYNLKLIIHQREAVEDSQRPSEYIINFTEPPFEVVKEKSNKEERCPLLFNHDSSSEVLIHLSFHGDSHYNSVRSLSESLDMHMSGPGILGWSNPKRHSHGIVGQTLMKIRPAERDDTPGYVNKAKEKSGRDTMETEDGTCNERNEEKQEEEEDTSLYEGLSKKEIRKLKRQKEKQRHNNNLNNSGGIDSDSEANLSVFNGLSKKEVKKLKKTMDRQKQRAATHYEKTVAALSFPGSDDEENETSSKLSSKVGAIQL